VVENRTQKKYENLKEKIKDMKKVVVAFSGGVDSTFLLRVCIDVLGKDNVVAVTVKSPIRFEEDLESVRKLSKELDVKLVEVEVDELTDERFIKNDELRCYYCKLLDFTKISEVAREMGFDIVLDGTNYDDVRNDYRPGIRALKELKIKSPLREVELTKEEIRKLSKELGLPTWNRPPIGCCLATRFRYGLKINYEDLERLRKIEDYIKKLNLTLDRVRYHDRNTVRIEVLPEEMEVIMKRRKEIVDFIKKQGFKYVSLDLEGYRTGSMNEEIGG